LPGEGSREETVRVFLWDDAEDVRAVAREALDEDPRFTVVGEAGTPEAALEHIAAERPDVVLLDLAMPDMDGLEALPRIGEAAPEARVVVFSSFEAARMEEVSLARGARAYVEKGTEIDDLRAVVHEVGQGPPGLAPLTVPPPPYAPVPRDERDAGPLSEPAGRLGSRPPSRGSVGALPGTVENPLLAVGVAAVLYGLIFVIPVSTSGRIDGITLLATLPTALLAMRFGLRGGLIAAAVSLLEIFLLSQVEEVRAAGAFPWVARAVVFMLLGGLLGAVVDRSRKVVAALGEANRELERSNEDLEQFAAAASHDLSEPLRGIQGFADLLRRRYRGRLDESADEYIDQITDGAGRLRVLIEDLLAYARTGSGGVGRQPVDTGALVDEVLGQLAVQIEESDAEVDVGELPTVMAEPALLGQVFQNLIANAVKFSDGGPPKVQVWAERRNGEHRFGVADDGIGISEGDEQRIFQVFKRLNAREAYGGTGMGLAICKRVVERHGGRIWVESRAGGGSVFHFTIADPDDVR
jgi:signal transduction histidine kinase/ActR/RegA family two-component response regulator